MAKDKIADYDASAAGNTDIGGIGIQGTNAVSNFDGAFREIMSQLKEADAGTSPLTDTWSFCDPADRTKIFRFDGGGITTATTRTLTIPDVSGTVAVCSAGSWTPTVIGSTSGSAVLSTSYASYVKIWRGVAYQVRVQLSSVGTLVGNVIITGLPFTTSSPDSSADWNHSASASNTTLGDAGMTAIISNNSTTIDLYKVRSAAGLLNITAADLTATSAFFVSGVYITDTV